MRRFVVPLVVVLLVAACSTDEGRALRAPPPGVTAPPRTVQATVPEPSPSDAAFVVSSDAFVADGVIPDRYTCEGDDVSPPLSWSGFPPGPVEFAIMVTDPDAGEFLHWAVWGIPSDVTSLAEGDAGLPAGAKQAVNDFGEVGWSGPCPPPGQAHRYVFQVHAMEAPLPLADGADARDFRAALASFAHGTLTGTFTAR
ncbi:MAG: YbhB/YbcL family Raf kinase inhibitor-like protein [Actinomycetota bacterium]